MFKLFNRYHEQIALIENPINPILVDTLNTIGELKFDLPTSSIGLELEGYIQVENEQEYVIKEIVKHGATTSVVCMLNIEEVLGMAYDSFMSKEKTVKETADFILVGTGWRVIDKSSSGNKTRNLYGRVTNAYNLLILMCTVFGVEITYDTYNKTVTIVDSIGSDNGAYFISHHNLKKVTHDTHSHKLITRVIPIGKDGLTIEKVNGGKKWLENHSYSNKVIYGIWQSDRHDNAQKLKEDAQKYLDEMAVPYETYEVVVDDVYKLIGDITFRYELGDVVTVIDAVTGVKVKQRVIQKTKHLLDPSQDTINVANKGMTFQEYYKRLLTIADMTESVLGSDGMIGGGNISNDSIGKDHIQSDSIYAHHISAGQIEADHIIAGSISAEHILADSITATHIQSDTIDTRHLKAESVTANEIKAGTITAGSGIIAEGAIGTAEISKIDAGKIKSGTIDTSLVTVSGKNSNLKLSGNRLQVFDGIGSAQVERVSLGDVNADGTIYGLRVRGADGQTVLYDENGVYREGITDGSINNDKIAGDANIDGGKLNINSVVTEINEGTTSISGNRIEVDNKSLTVAIDDIQTTQNEQGEKISKNSSDILANANEIKTKVSSQTYEEDKAGNTTKFENMQSQITQNANSISTKVEQHIFNEETGKINSAISTVDQKADGISTKVTDLNGKYTELKQTVDGIDITGMVTFSDLSTQGRTTIHGGNIKTGTVYADYFRGRQLTAMEEINFDGGARFTALMTNGNKGVNLSTPAFQIGAKWWSVSYDGNATFEGVLDVMPDAFTNNGILGTASGFKSASSGNASVGKDMYANNFLSRYSLLDTAELYGKQPRTVMNTSDMLDSLNVAKDGDSFKIRVVEPVARTTGEVTSPFLVQDEEFGTGLDLESVVATLLESVKELKKENEELKKLIKEV